MYVGGCVGIKVVVELGLDEFLSSHRPNRLQMNFKKSWNFFKSLISRLTLDHRELTFQFKIHVVLLSLQLEL